MLEIDQQVGCVLLEPAVVVVVPNGLVEIALILGDCRGAQPFGGVEVTTREIVIELGERVSARRGIEILLLKRHVAVL
jgi:hypothetical protein